MATVWRLYSMTMLILNLLRSSLALSEKDQLSSKDCLKSRFSLYEGTHNHTQTGIPCQRWDVNLPHRPKYILTDGGHHNYCRNPNFPASQRNWCYTTDPKVRWDYCNISKCPDDSRVYWTSYEASNTTSRILYARADPELSISDHVNGSPNDMNVYVLKQSDEPNTEIRALAGDVGKKILFYSDFKSHHIGVFNYSSHVTTAIYDGMAKGIQSMVYDWMEENLYWVDADLNWIMVSESTFRYYTPIYRSTETLHALAIHVNQRKLYFSTYQPSESKIIVSDLAGKNQRVLFRYSGFENVLVRGLTIDYTDDRLYWTNQQEFGSAVVSSNLDGTDKRVHHYQNGTNFWGIAAYMDFIYVTDVQKVSKQGVQSHYTVQVFSKHPYKNFTYSHTGRPRQIIVLSADQARSPLDRVSSSYGECNNETSCDHICLPRINATRECVCSLGYHKVGEVGCQPQLVNDGFMYVVDIKQSEIFQIPLNASDEDSATYSIVPVIDGNTTITAFAENPVSRHIFWSNAQNRTIMTSLPDGSNKRVLSHNIYAVSIAVDAPSENVFFVANNRKDIYVMSPDGSYKRAIKKSNSNKANIQMIALDIVNRMIYWTDTRSKKGSGQVWRMDLDGSNKVMVMGKLDWPHALDFDYKSGSLYVCDSQIGVIYKVPRVALRALTSTSKLGTDMKKYSWSLAEWIDQSSLFITDLKVQNNVVYFIERNSNKVYTFDVKIGLYQLTTLETKDFYQLTTLAIHNESYYNLSTEKTDFHCLTRKASCPHICVDSFDTSKCLCAQGYGRVGNECIIDYIRKNKAPTHNGTCPKDMKIHNDKCQDSATLNLNELKWSDDRTPAHKIILNKAYLQTQLLVEGKHFHYFDATDGVGAVGVCSFNVVVEVIHCTGSLPPLPGDMRASPLQCGTRFGSSYSIQCNDSKELVAVGNSYNIMITNKCDETGSWTIRSFDGYKCRRGDEIPQPHNNHLIILISVSCLALCCTLILFVILIGCRCTSLPRNIKAFKSLRRSRDTAKREKRPSILPLQGNRTITDWESETRETSLVFSLLGEENVE